MSKEKRFMCVYCGKQLEGFIFDHNCEKKNNNSNLWNSRKIGRRNKPKTEREMWKAAIPA
jgi:hypothetical protein